MSTNNVSWLPSFKQLAFGVGVATACYAGYVVYSYVGRDKIPKKWRRLGTLQQLNIFPVKSCAPLKMELGEVVSCDVLGPHLKSVRDRMLMVINENNEMLTARAYPKMLLIVPKLISDSSLLFNAPGMPELILDFASLEKEKSDTDVRTAVWGVKLDARLCGTRFDTWFSQFILGEPVGLKLVYYPYSKPVRSTNPRLKDQPHLKQEDSGTFGDATSYMLMNLSSVNDLNTRLTRPVEPLQFRGNFELKMDTHEPYAEDKWQWLRIGDDAVFRVVAPCTRCILPNINVTTADRDIDGEPLKTLRSYRLFDYTSPALGIHLGLRLPGNVKVNDVIYVEDK